MRHFVEQHHPPSLFSSLPRPGPSHVHDLVAFEAARAGDLEGALAGVDGEDAAFGAGGILQSAEGDEENGAERNPRGVDQPEAPGHGDMIRTVTRGEIRETLIQIVRKEKNVAEDLLKEETPLAEAGIDSLDALTILFAIEEQFHISIPDERARAVVTFGDLVDVVEQLVPTA